MPRSEPRTLLEALTRRRFLLTRWPGRALLHLLSTPAVALGAAMPLWLLGLPWLYLLTRGSRIDEVPAGTVAVLVLLGAVQLAGFGPLVALPLAALERLRLRLVDPRPVDSGHRPLALPRLGGGSGSGTPSRPPGGRSATPS